MIITSEDIRRMRAQNDQARFDLTVDFGKRTVPVTVRGHRAVIDTTFEVDLGAKVKDNFCYMVKEEGLVPIAFFSEENNRFYKLIATRDWPSFSLGSVPMHSITRSSPREDTLRKIALLKPYGYVLDTCMGLGYTAICAAHSSSKVVTFERDENVRFLAEINPWSEELFSSPVIETRIGDIACAAGEFKNGVFDCIIHDPPTFTIAPELFAVDFYRALARVLKKGGRLYHYLPRYKMRQGYDFPSKIKDKCRKAGFSVSAFLPEQGDLLCTL